MANRKQPIAWIPRPAFPRKTERAVKLPSGMTCWTQTDQGQAIMRGLLVAEDQFSRQAILIALPNNRNNLKTENQEGILRHIAQKAREGDDFYIKLKAFVRAQDEYGFTGAWDMSAHVDSHSVPAWYRLWYADPANHTRKLGKVYSIRAAEAKRAYEDRSAKIRAAWVARREAKRPKHISDLDEATQEYLEASTALRRARQDEHDKARAERIARLETEARLAKKAVQAAYAKRWRAKQKQLRGLPSGAPRSPHEALRGP